MGWQDESEPISKGKAKPIPSVDTPSPSTAAPSPAAAGGGWQSESEPISKQSAADIPSVAAKPKGYDDATTAGLVGDTAYRAANTGTLGALDYLNAGQHWLRGDEGFGDSLARIHKENDEWGANHPYLGVAADLVGYGAGLGKIGIGAKIAGRLGEGVLARAGGAALEGAGTGVIADEAHSAGQASVGDLLKTAALSGTVGAVAGAIPGEGGALAKDVSQTGGLKTATSAAFKPLEATHYDAGAIGKDFDAVKSTLAAKQTGSISDSLDSQIDKISRAISDKQKAKQSVTADDITNFQLDINKAAQGGRDIGIAKAYDAALDKTLLQTRPLLTPLSGPAEIAAKSDAARAAALKSNTSGELDDWIKQAQSGDVAGTKADIQKSLDKNPAFYTNVGDQLKAAAEKPGLTSKIVEKLAHPVGDALVTGGAEYMFGGHDLGAALATGAAGAAGGAVLGHALSQKRTNDLVSQLARARHINANGAAPPLAAFKPGIPIVGPMGTYGRQIAPALGASGAFMDYGR